MNESTFREDLRDLMRELKQTQQAQLDLQIKQTEILVELKNVVPRVSTVENKLEELQAFNHKVIGAVAFVCFAITTLISLLSLL